MRHGQESIFYDATWVSTLRCGEHDPEQFRQKILPRLETVTLPK
jgi:hypothetical protein